MSRYTALHHYDEIGLLVPGARSAAGYRLYSLADLKRLRQILFYRALGFGLAEIAGILADTGADADDHLRRQHRLVRGQQSQRRAASYAKRDWIAIQAEATAINQDWLEAPLAGEPASGQAAMDLAERHRQHLSRWLYDCGHGMHRGLAAMYTADERFRADNDGLAPGLAQYVHDAIQANANRAAAS